MTIRWSVRIGATTGTARLWLPELIIHQMIITAPRRVPGTQQQRQRPPRTEKLTALWRAIAGSVFMPQGTRRFRKGGVLPLSDCNLSGTPQSPSGPILLVCDMADPDLTQSFPAEPVPASGGRLLRITGPRRLTPDLVTLCPRGPNQR